MLETVLTGLIIVAFWWGDDIMALLYQVIGRPKAGLTKRQAKKLQRQHTEALDILREIDAYDRFAVNPLPTEVHDRLRTFLDQHKGTAALPRREDG